MDMHQRCTLWPSTGLRVLADGFTVQHVAAGVLRPLTAFLGSQLADINGYFEVRVLACAPKGSIKVGLFDKDGPASRSRTIPLVEDMLVRYILQLCLFLNLTQH